MDYIYYQTDDIELKFITTNKLFSPKAIDKGTLAMLSILKLEYNEKST